MRPAAPETRNHMPQHVPGAPRSRPRPSPRGYATASSEVFRVAGLDRGNVRTR
jgi:hypothetical protein